MHDISPWIQEMEVKMWLKCFHPPNNEWNAAVCVLICMPIMMSRTGFQPSLGRESNHKLWPGGPTLFRSNYNIYDNPLTQFSASIIGGCPSPFNHAIPIQLFSLVKYHITSRVVFYFIFIKLSKLGFVY